MIRIVSCGYASIQDLGRLSYAQYGVPRSGAVDPWSLRRGNRLCGNSDDDAAVEIALGETVLDFEQGTWIATIGCDAVSVDGVAADLNTAIEAGTGSRVSIRHSKTSAFSYLCVAGGVQAEPVLGSRSTCAAARIGNVLRAGDTLPVFPGTVRTFRRLHRKDAAQDPIRVIPGPHLDAFDAGALAQLLDGEYVVDVRSNRVGRRLEGGRLQHSAAGEIDPAGMVPGAIQVPPDGRPIVLGPDGPVTGGYPVIATVIAADLAAIMQLRPGSTARFAACGIDEARAAWLERERRLDEDVRDG